MNPTKDIERVPEWIRKWMAIDAEHNEVSVHDMWANSHLDGEDIETIVASAVISKKWIIHIWKRHCNCYWKIDYDWWDFDTEHSWFLTSNNRYVDRVVGYDIASYAWQIKEAKPTWCLYSEDLW